MNVREELFKNQDLKYRDFHKRLVPNIDGEKIIGVRAPQLRAIGKRLQNNNFLWEYYEEIMLHGFYIGYSKLSFDEKLELLDEFVPMIDNWAVCDMVCSTLKFVEKSKAEFLDYLQKFMFSEKEFEKRFAIVILMDYYLDDEYAQMTVDFLGNISGDYYYVNMAAAWALSVAFVKHRYLVMPLIEGNALTAEIHNMTLSKLRDSFRVDKETKEYLKTLKR